MSAASTYDVCRPGVSSEDLQLILEKTPASVWDVLRGQHVFLTGGTGFVGCWLLEALLWASEQLALNLRVTVLTRQPDNFHRKAAHLAGHPSVRLLKGDVLDLSQFDEAVDIVIHAATDVASGSSDPVQVFDDIVNGTKETLALSLRCKAQRYLLTSSGAVYGRQPSDMDGVDETFQGAPDTLEPTTAYGQGKRASEWLVQCHARQYGLQTAIARCFALLGPYLPLDAHFAAGNFINDVLSGRDITVKGDGTAYRSYLYAADMTIWLLTILANGKKETAYNLGSSTGVSIRELAEAASVLSERTSSVIIACAPLPSVRPLRYVPCVNKAMTELGLREYTSLQSALKKTFEWAKRQKELPHSFGTNHV